MNGEPHLSLEETQARVSERKFPRVTKESIEARIKNAEYMQHDQLTICIITMKNGFKAIGKAAPADPRNFDVEIGHRYAFEDAFRTLWPIEGYLLCEQLHGGETHFEQMERRVASAKRGVEDGSLPDVQRGVRHRVSAGIMEDTKLLDERPDGDV